LIRDLLEPLGFIVIGAAGGRECLNIVEHVSPDIILLDIAMPEMDGWEVAQRIRRHPGKRIAILMLSANAIDPHHMVEAERLYDDTLMKPIDLRQLLKKIHALLDIEWIYETQVARQASRGNGRSAGRRPRCQTMAISMSCSGLARSVT
jgi:CheY-like chemotaxis protein